MDIFFIHELKIFLAVTRAGILLSTWFKLFEKKQRKKVQLIPTRGYLVSSTYHGSDSKLLFKYTLSQHAHVRKPTSNNNDKTMAVSNGKYRQAHKSSVPTRNCTKKPK